MYNHDKIMSYIEICHEMSSMPSWLGKWRMLANMVWD
jgi:hypothetical protein